jgi:hypothetical protein
MLCVMAPLAQHKDTQHKDTQHKDYSKTSFLVQIKFITED